jgi:hypothetical protein
MAYITQISTSTLNNQNISVALLAHTFTNNTRIRKVWIDVFLDQVAGNGDYIAYITRQKAGAGSFYESIRTTKAAAAGVTSVMFNSIPLIVNATDVVRVYVIGLAGDIATPDIITEVNEEWVGIDASGRVDVGAWVGTVMVATLFNGITLLANWLRLLARKDAAIAADAAAQLAEIDQDMGTGAGAFDNTTDSQEAIRDQLAPGATTHIDVDFTDVVT